MPFTLAVVITTLIASTRSWPILQTGRARGNTSAICLGGVDAILNMLGERSRPQRRDPTVSGAIRFSQLQHTEDAATKRAPRQQLARTEGQLATTQNELDKALRELAMRQLKPTGSGYMSSRGGLTLALRRCVANVTCRALPLALGVDMHRATASRWEVK